MNGQYREAVDSSGPMACLVECKRICAQEKIEDSVDKRLVDSHEQKDGFRDYQDYDRSQYLRRSSKYP